MRQRNQPAEPAPEAAPEPQPQGWPVLTDAEVQHLKDNNLNLGMPMHKVEFSGQTYVIRALASQEWVDLTKRILDEDARSPVDPARQDEYICGLGVIWPLIPAEGRSEFWARNLAGAARSLVLQIRQKSGFSTITDDGTIVGDSLTVTPLTDPAPAPTEPTEEEIAAMKANAPGGIVFRAEFPGGGVHYLRPWRRDEWEQIQAQEERGKDSRDFGVRLALLWSSSDWSRPALAGTVEGLFEAVWSQSGFSASPTVTPL